MIDGETAPAPITEQKKKSTKDRICQLRRGNKNIDKQKEVRLIKNARHCSLIYESTVLFGSLEISGMTGTL